MAGKNKINQLQSKKPVTASKGNYIKLGEKASFENLCLSDGTLRLAYYEVPHLPALNGDKNAIKKAYHHCDARTASGHARQVLEFYDPSEETLWVTFAGGFLWWCKALPKVEYLGSNKKLYPHGSRLRRTVSGWSNKDIDGNELLLAELKGQLIKTSGYRQTICDLKPPILEYVLRKINNNYVPQVLSTRKAVDQLLLTLVDCIKSFNPKDLELLVELTFSRNGWQRITATGGTMKTADIIYYQPITDERIMVQVKSQTSQVELNKYIKAIETWPVQKLFYVYHTSNKALTLEVPDSRVTVIGPEQLAKIVFRSGLVEWVMDKAA